MLEISFLILNILQLVWHFLQQQILKNSSKSANPTFMDPNNPHWGWSWLERWMAARPWANRSANDRELNSDYASVKSATSFATSVSGLSKTHFRHDNKPSPTVQKPCRVPIWKSPSTPPSRATKTTPKGSGGGSGGGDDAMSMQSFRSERYRRHSTGGSSVRDDESLASSPAAPRYMGSTNSAKARSKLPSPLGINGTPEKALVGSAKKRLSFSPSSAGTRRHSGPPKLVSEEKISNGVRK